MINLMLGLVEAFAFFFAIIFSIAFIGRFINKDKKNGNQEN